ncbi:MAG: hypothetical protein IKK55_04030 [Clostridia bacterium]|nr:hypothetical protein [Clostridia bacterium]
MKQPKLKYTFHNPNTPEKSADYILKVFIDSGLSKVEEAIKETAVHKENSV